MSQERVRKKGKNMSEVKCFYKDRCLDYPYRCDKCAHNLGKAHHFKPIN